MRYRAVVNKLRRLDIPDECREKVVRVLMAEEAYNLLKDAHRTPYIYKHTIEALKLIEALGPKDAEIELARNVKLVSQNGKITFIVEGRGKFSVDGLANVPNYALISLWKAPVDIMRKLGVWS